MTKKLSAELIDPTTKAVLDAVLVELAAVRTTLEELRLKHIVLAAKLDDDATVTDTDYESLCTVATAAAATITR